MTRTYTVAVRSSTSVPGDCIWELRPSSTQRLLVRRIFVGLDEPAFSEFALSRAAAVGATPTSVVLGQANDPADTVTTAGVATAWATRPVPGIDLRRIALDANEKRTGEWSFGKGGLLLPLTGSLVITNVSRIGRMVNGAADIWVEWSE